MAPSALFAPSALCASAFASAFTSASSSTRGGGPKPKPKPKAPKRAKIDLLYKQHKANVERLADIAKDDVRVIRSLVSTSTSTLEETYDDGDGVGGSGGPPSHLQVEIATALRNNATAKPVKVEIDDGDDA